MTILMPYVIIAVLSTTPNKPVPSTPTQTVIPCVTAADVNSPTLPPAVTPIITVTQYATNARQPTMIPQPASIVTRTRTASATDAVLAQSPAAA